MSELKPADKPFSVKEIKAAQAVIAAEHKYTHRQYSEPIDGKNCFCALGALAKVRKYSKGGSGVRYWQGGRAQNILARQFSGNPACQTDIGILGDYEQPVTRGVAIDILDRFIAAIREK